MVPSRGGAVQLVEGARDRVSAVARHYKTRWKWFLHANSLDVAVHLRPYLIICVTPAFDT